jgi:nitrate reductase gamma subunit
LQQVLNQAFVDSLHGMFIIAGIAVLTVSLLAAVLLWQTRSETKREATDSPVTTEELLAVSTITEER